MTRSQLTAGFFCGKMSQTALDEKGRRLADFLMETALLTHGLSSISDEELSAVWPWSEPRLVWLERGQICHGSMADFLPFRQRSRELIRIDRQSLARARREKLSGALTASGTMAVAEEMSVHFAVSAGIGGIGQIVGEELCADLPALVETDIVLVATSPKDVVDIPATVAWLMNHGVHILGRNSASCDGFMFRRDPVALSGRLTAGSLIRPHTLLLSAIDPAKRLNHEGILPAAVAAGRAAEREGRAFHPAANQMIDRLSDGLSSRLQLASLIDNGSWAEKLTAE